LLLVLKLVLMGVLNGSYLTVMADPTDMALQLVLPYLGGVCGFAVHLAVKGILLLAINELGLDKSRVVWRMARPALNGMINPLFMTCTHYMSVPAALTAVMIVPAVADYAKRALMQGVVIYQESRRRGSAAKVEVYMDAEWFFVCGFWPVAHVSLVCPKMKARYEGHFPEGQGLGKLFVVRHIWNTDCKKRSKHVTRLPLNVSVSTFMNLQKCAKPYSGKHNCITTTIESIGGVMTPMAGTSVSVVALALMLSMTTLTLVTMLAVGLVGLTVALLDEMHLQTPATIRQFSDNGWLSLAAMADREDAKISLYVRSFMASLTAANTGFGGTPTVEDARKAVDYLGIALDDDVVEDVITSLGYTAGLASKHRLGDLQSSYAIHNETVNEPALAQAAERLTTLSTRQNHLSVAWKEHVLEELIQLADNVGAATANAFNEYARSLQTDALASDDEGIRNAVLAFQELWPVHMRHAISYVRAVADFIASMKSRLNDSMRQAVENQLAPLTMLEILELGPSPGTRQQLERLQATNNSLYQEPTVFGQFLRIELDIAEQRTTLEELELVKAVASKAQTYSQRLDAGNAWDWHDENDKELIFHAMLAAMERMGIGAGPVNSDEQWEELVEHYVCVLTGRLKAYAVWLLHRPAHVYPEWGHAAAVAGGLGMPVKVDELKDTIQLLGEFMALSTSEGFDLPVAWGSAASALGTYVLRMEEQADEEARLRGEAAKAAYGRFILDRPDTAITTVVGWFTEATNWALSNEVVSAVWMQTVYWFNALKRGVEEALQGASQVILGALVELKRQGMTKSFDIGLNILVGLVDVFGVRDRNPKVVWAPLFRMRRKPLTEAERFAATVAPMSYADLPPEEAVADTIERLVANGAGEMPELLRAYTRPVYRPQRAYGTAQEFEGINDPPSLVDDDGVLESRVASYVREMGAAQGIDGTWLTSEASNQVSIDRYIPAPHPTSAGLEAKCMEAAEAVYEKYKEMHENPGVVTPEVVRKYIEKKFSAGIPFMMNYKTRAAVYNSPYGEALMSAAREALRTGSYPQMLIHGFHKMQVVNKASLLAGKAVRTVTAQDLLSMFVDQCVMLERSKRAAPTTVDIGIGRPLTEGGLREQFRRVLARKQVVESDETEYDANQHQAIHAGLAHLSSLGFSSNPNGAALASVTKAHYAAMERKTIFNLIGGKATKSKRGGATGVSQTSWNNTWGGKIKTIAAWSVLQNKPCNKFFETNTFVNMSDDNMLGTDDKLDPGEWKECMLALFGAKVQLVPRDVKMDVQYLAKRVAPGSDFAEDYEELGVPVPDLAVYHDPQTVLMRRSAMTVRLAGLPKPQHYRQRIQRTVGHATLMAHNRGMYSVFANEWMDDVRNFLGVKTGEGIFTITIDDKGNVRSAEVADTYVPSSAENANRLAFVKKTGKLPAYLNIMAAFLEEDDPVSLLARERKLAKLSTSILAVNYLELISGLVSDFLVSSTPSWLVGLQAEVDARAPIMPYAAGDYYLERFVHLAILRKSPLAPTLSDILSVAQESPFRHIMDIPGYMFAIENPSSRRELEAITFDIARNYAVIMVFAYATLNLIMESASSRTGLKVISRIYRIGMIDLPRMYSAANLAHWLLTGRSSPKISALQPKDAYIVEKQVSRAMAYVSRSFIIDIGISPWLEEAALTVLNLTSKIAASAVHGDAVYAPRSVDSRWLQVAVELRDAWIGSDPYHALDAPTGTGKSTALPAAMRALDPSITIFLLVPRRILVSEYTDLYGLKPYKLTPYTTEWQGSSFVVMTYGAFLARKEQIALIPNSIVLMDEFHEGTPEQVATYHQTKNFNRLLLSATLDIKLFPEVKRIYRAPIRSRFSVDELVLDMPVADMYASLAKTYPTQAARALIIVPKLADANRIRNSLVAGNIEAHVVSRFSPSFPTSGVLVATQVVDAGANITPAPAMVIDNGRRIVSDKGALIEVNSDPMTKVQRKGRTGRQGDGIYVCPPFAGTGPTPTAYPNWALYTYSESLRVHYNRILGLTVELQAITDGTLVRVGADADTTILTRDLLPNRMEAMTTVNVVASLSVYYAMLVTTGEHKAAINTYTKFVETGQGLIEDASAPMEFQIRALITPMVQCLPIEDLLIYLNASPYETNVNGQVWRHCGLVLKGNSVQIMPLPSQEAERRFQRRPK